MSADVEPRRARRPRRCRAALDERRLTAGRAVEDGERVAGVSSRSANAWPIFPSPTTPTLIRSAVRRRRCRLTPFMPPFSSRNDRGVRRPRPSSRAGRSASARPCASSTSGGFADHTGCRRRCPGGARSRGSARARRPACDEALDAAVHRRDRRRAGVRDAGTPGRRRAGSTPRASGGRAARARSPCSRRASASRGRRPRSMS